MFTSQAMGEGKLYNASTFEISGQCFSRMNAIEFIDSCFKFI